MRVEKQSKNFVKRKYVKTSKKLNHKRLLVTLLLVIITIVFFAGLDKYYHYKKTNLPFQKDLIGEKIQLNHKISNISGEFGDLEIIPVLIQATPDYFKYYCMCNESISLIKSKIKWVFKSTTIENIKAIFENAGISQKDCNILISNTHAIESGYTTIPPDSLILAFSQEIRLKLYGYLGNADNPLYQKPFYFNSENIEDWFFKCNLKKETIETLSKLIYIQDDICYLSDVHLIVSQLKTDNDWNHLLQFLFRATALEVNLKIKEGQDISKIVQYWGNLGREEEVEKILTPLKNRKGGGKIEIVNLFPTIAKQRLNTFLCTEESSKYTRDCLWTMFNFFNSISDERFDKDANKPELFGQIAKEVIYDHQLKFGDIIILQDKTDNVFHGCVYITNDIVFTKNGMTTYSSNSPFILSEYKKMMKLYRSGQEIVRVHKFNRIQGETNDLACSR